MSRCSPEKEEKSTDQEKGKMLNGSGGHGHSHYIPGGLVEEGGFEV